MSEARARWSFRVSTSMGTGAIGVIDVMGDIDAFFDDAGMEPVEVGAIRLRDILGLDTGLVARWGGGFAQLMAHGGVFLVGTIMGALQEAGGELACPSPDDERLLAWYPEAVDVHEARMLACLPRVTCQRAIGLLLDQPERWRTYDGDEESREVVEHSRVLNRMLAAPLVVLVGGANIGKSTLTNAMAMDSVSVVSSEAGTTRDHVGVELLVDGLAVRWVDTPGLRQGPAHEAELGAAEMSEALARRADLVVLCRDRDTGFPSWNELEGQGCLRVGLRGDMGEAPGCEIQTASGVDRRGLGELSRAIRERLVPEEAMESALPWRFWDGLERCQT
ncbi:MAG: GTPase [Phycisphaerales bacterium JB043]